MPPVLESSVMRGTRQHPDDRRREARLRDILRRPREVAVAFSGGVDSSYLLAVAAEVRAGRRLGAYLGVSPSLSAHQRAQAHRVAAEIAVPLEEVPTSELERSGYRANRGDRCYFCKDTLFGALQARAPEAVLVDGTNHDDLGAHRPGLRAGRLHGVRSPLAEVGLGKAAVRRLSQARGLFTAALPASPCLASRVPAGTKVDAAALGRIEAAEELLRGHGFRDLRVRHHGDLARVEVPLEELPALARPGLRERVVAGLRSVGYRFVTLDLEGFRSGSGSHVDGDAAP